jgi:hypothetical protein
MSDPTPTPLPASPDWRALCQELLQPLAEYDGANPYREHRDLITRVRTALATPPAAVPSDEKLWNLQLAARIQTHDGVSWQTWSPGSNAAIAAFRSLFNHGYEHGLAVGRAALATTPARLRQCPTHGQQPENAWGCPECVRELREELAATEESSAPQPDPTPPAVDGDERLRLVAAGISSGYTAGHDATVDGHYGDPDEVAAETAPMVLTEVDATTREEGAVRPTEAELFQVLMQNGGETRATSNKWLEPFTRAVLARWGGAAVQPVPVDERPWEQPGWCDAEGRCWWFAPTDAIPGGFRSAGWGLYAPAPADEDTHCLPHWAIPVPQPPQGREGA